MRPSVSPGWPVPNNVVTCLPFAQSATSKMALQQIVNRIQNLLHFDLFHHIRLNGPHCRSTRRPACGFGWTEQCYHRCAYRGRQMSNAGVVPNVQPSSGQPTSQLIQVVHSNSALKRIVRAGTPCYPPIELPRQLAESIERPVFLCTGGKRMQHDKIILTSRADDARRYTLSALHLPKEVVGHMTWLVLLGQRAKKLKRQLQTADRFPKFLAVPAVP